MLDARTQECKDARWWGTRARIPMMHGLSRPPHLGARLGPTNAPNHGPKRAPHYVPIRQKHYNAVVFCLCSARAICGPAAAVAKFRCSVSMGKRRCMVDVASPRAPELNFAQASVAASDGGVA